MNFSNSGAEAIEARSSTPTRSASTWSGGEYERVTRTLHDFYTEARAVNGPEVASGGKKLIDFRDDVDEYNLGQFEHFQDQPVVIALKGVLPRQDHLGAEGHVQQVVPGGLPGPLVDPRRVPRPERPARVAEGSREKKCVFSDPDAGPGPGRAPGSELTRVIGGAVRAGPG